MRAPRSNLARAVCRSSPTDEPNARMEYDCTRRTRQRLKVNIEQIGWPHGEGSTWDTSRKQSEYQ